MAYHQGTLQIQKVSVVDFSFQRPTHFLIRMPERVGALYDGILVQQDLQMKLRSIFLFLTEDSLRGAPVTHVLRAWTLPNPGATSP
jgi:hypothetical protein